MQGIGYKVMHICIHGIRDSGPTTTDKLTVRLRTVHGIPTRNFIYPPVRIWNAEKRLDQNALMLSRYIQACESGTYRGVSLVAHSYGCLVAFRLLELDDSLRLDRLHMIAPAMLTDAAWSLHRDKYNAVSCYVNPKDLATRLASLAHFTAPRMGSAGHKGFLDPVVRNFYRRDGSGIWNHSRAWFDADGLEYLGQRIAEEPPTGGA